jgi:hypothetical protein
VLGPCIPKFFDDVGPFFSVLEDIVNEELIFLLEPGASHFVGVEVVEPSLATLLSGSEIHLFRLDEKFLGDLVPLLLGLLGA